MKALPILFSMICFFLFKSSAYERLDPHGNSNEDYRTVLVETHSECRACHTVGANKFETTKALNETCFSCHGTRPHSGIEEHLTKTWKGQPFTCLNCHSAHRFGAIPSSSESSWVGEKLKKKPIPSGLVNKKSKHVMLSHNCVECHSWK